MYCPHCGFENIDGMRFCVECGALLPDMSQLTAGGAQGGAPASLQNENTDTSEPGNSSRRVVDLGETQAAAPGTYAPFDTEGPESTGVARPVAYVPESTVRGGGVNQTIQSPMPAHDTRFQRSSGEGGAAARVSTRAEREAVLAEEDRPKSLLVPILAGLVMGLVAIGIFLFAMNSCLHREAGRVVEAPTTHVSEEPEAAETPEPATEEEEQPTEVSPKESLNAYSWDELAKIGKEIAESANETEALSVAAKYNLVSNGGSLSSDTKRIELSDGSLIEVRLVGIYHDNAAENMHKTGLTFLTTTAAASHRVQPIDTNEGGWGSSELRMWMNSSSGLLGMFPQDLRENIIPAAKETNNVGHSTSTDCVSATSDTLWIPSIQEVAGDINWTWSSDPNNSGNYNAIMNAEGEQYQFFEEAGVSTASANGVLSIPDITGNSVRWWLRSCSVSVNNHFRYVGANGDPSLFEDATLEMGIVFGFTL